MWRYGVLYRACLLTELISRNPQSKQEILTSFQKGKYHNVNVQDVIELTAFANWIASDGEGVLRITDQGLELLSLKSDILRMRRQVENLLDLLSPDWAALAVQGRQSLLRYVDKNILQCFTEAGLADSTDPDVIYWWDRLAEKFRGIGSHHLTEIGRAGERLSYEFEFERTGFWPNWIALDHSGVGYDLVSRVSKDDVRSLVIEVKTTKQNWKYAGFFISRNEWDVLSSNHNAVIHLWRIGGSDRQLAVITTNILRKHIPSDQGGGVWKKLWCPFSEFSVYKQSITKQQDMANYESRRPSE